MLDESQGTGFSFTLRHPDESARIVLRKSSWKTGRRFDVARLLGDQLASAGLESLFPATHADTYRQKWQRAFAAELLCPFEPLRERLGGDLSDEGIEREAQHFGVSSLAVRTILVNNGLLERTSLEDEAIVA